MDNKPMTEEIPMERTPTERINLWWDKDMGAFVSRHEPSGTVVDGGTKKEVLIELADSFMEDV